MNLRTRIHLLFLAAAIALAACLTGTQQHAAIIPAQAQAQVQSQSFSEPMPVDPQITIGKFANGMRYYIRANKKPEKRAELRLVVKAGSILEDDDQQGMAHMVEHMAFNGTQHFPKDDLVHFIESLGMRFGADLNAYTSFDETVYMLQVPTDKPETMDRAMLILEDWAHNVSFDSAEIEKERGVVMEEWRLRRGAGARMTDKLFPIAFKGSRYADRIPIGKPEIIQGGKPERLKKFYTDWYRPDLMAVVAVGDFDKTAIENLVKTHFGSIPAANNPRPRPSFDIPDHPGTVYAITTDKEMTTTSVGITNILPSRQQGTVAEYRQEIIDNLFSAMLTSRFQEIAQKPDAPFIFAGAGRGNFLARDKDGASLTAIVKEGGVERGLEALLVEADRVTRFGFTATEMDRQKQDLLRGYERAAVEKESRESSSRADEYIRNFLSNEPLPAIDDEYGLHQRFLPQITLEEINKLAKEWYSDRYRLVVLSAHEKSGLVIPDESKLEAVIKAAGGKELKAYADTVASATLLDSMPAPGSITKSATKDILQITEWELSNGVKVVLKPTTFKADEILFRATSPGGTSLASDKDYIPAATATQPRADADAFSIQATRAKTMLANQTAVPEFAFFEALAAARFQNHSRRRFPTPATVDEWNLDKSLAFYKDRFADASNFTFVFVGNFDLATMKPMVEKYLGSLPALHRKETWKDVGARSAAGVVEKRVDKGIEPKSLAAIVFSGPFKFDQTNRVAIRAMSEVLENRLREAIREELGGTYSITANAGYQKNPNSEYTIAIEFGCAPERTDDLIKRVFQEIEQFKTAGPTDKQVNDEKEALLRDFETNSKQNGFLLAQLMSRYQSGEDPAAVWGVPDYYKKLDSAMIKEAARTYLNAGNYVKVTLFPEKKQAASAN